MKCLRRLLPELNLQEEKVSPETLQKLIIQKNDFENAIREIMPSALREVYVEPQTLDGMTLVVWKQSNENYRKQ